MVKKVDEKYLKTRAKVGEYLSAIIMYEMVRGCNFFKVAGFLIETSGILIETHFEISDRAVITKKMFPLLKKLEKYLDKEYAYLPDDLRIAQQIREDFERSKPMIEEIMGDKL